jgi:hypothetical protein
MPPTQHSKAIKSRSSPIGAQSRIENIFQGPDHPNQQANLLRGHAPKSRHPMQSMHPIIGLERTLIGLEHP